MSLQEYTRKRKFNKTPEPAGEKGDKKDRNRFVVQRHDASRLHYDLRLELDGVLKSWAVPKGPSLYPGDKRLAIQTEDHPVKYLTFEGIIPKGNYGAGEMHIWDTGTYTNADKASLQDQMRRGSLKLKFDGENLKGEFALVKTTSKDDKAQWLLIKKKDKYASEKKYDAEKVKAAVRKNNEKGLNMKKRVKPMLATLSTDIFDSEEWIYELKWDGYRAIGQVDKGKVELYSRNGHSFNSRFESIYEELSHISHQAILDGEIVAVDKKGVPNFQVLQNQDQNEDYELIYYVFDILYLNGHDLKDKTVLERKKLIPDVIEGLGRIKYCDHIEAMGTAFLKMALEKGMEGVIAKKISSAYSTDSRSKNWLKLKGENSIEALICGYTESDAQEFGSLILGTFEDDKLVYIGNCGTGFNAESRKSLLKMMKKLSRKTTPFDEDISLKGRQANWITPKLICEVKYTERTKSGHLRHPSFKGLRQDKDKEDLKIPEKKTSPPVNGNEENTLMLDDISVHITHPDKIYWPDEDLRKYDLLDYYLKISEVILPYLIDRPQNLHRHPNGIDKPGFFQKDSGGQMPEWMKTFKIHSKSSEKDIEYVLCQNSASLIYLANLGCIELNPWNSRISTIDKPDYTVIDIDPSDKNNFEQVIEVALAAKEVLDKAGITAYPKTSGSSGIHIYIPLGAKYTYDDAKDFTKLLCQFIMHKLPKLTSMERSPSKRKNKIYLDFLQNRRGQTLAAPYCVRPKPGATASAPLKWEEIKPGLDMREFNIHTMPQRIAEVGDLYKGVLKKGIDMSKALENLE